MISQYTEGITVNIKKTNSDNLLYIDYTPDSPWLQHILF